MFALIAKVTMLFQYIFFRKNEWFIKKQSILSELKGNYMDSQAHSLVIAIQSTILIFKLPTISITIMPFV